MGEITEENDEQSVQVRFTTRQPEFAIPAILYSVSAKSTNADLSQLVNAVLKESEDDGFEPVAFDFRVGDDVLRSTIDKLIESRMLQKESVLELEYFTKETAPEPCLSCPHPDWVSAVSAINAADDTLILTGCYDGSVNLWSFTDGLVATVQCHSAPVKSVALVQCANNEIVAISGSHDQTVMLNRAVPATSRADDWKLEPIILGRGHAGSVDCAAVSPNLQRFATGSWDTMLKIWDLLGSSGETAEGESDTILAPSENENDSTAHQAHGSKRKARKTDNTNVGTGVDTAPCKRVVPLVTLSGHNEGISDLAWINDAELVTVGFDHALVFWDLAIGREKRKIPGVRAFLSVSYSPLTNCLLTSSTDRHIRLYDPRSDEGNVVKSTFTSHGTWVSAVDWSKSSEHLFVSGSYDTIMKLWDIRSPKIPLFDMTGHEDKILDVCWSSNDYLVSASADSTMKIFSKKRS